MNVSLRVALVAMIAISACSAGSTDPAQPAPTARVTPVGAATAAPPAPTPTPVATTTTPPTAAPPAAAPTPGPPQLPPERDHGAAEAVRIRGYEGDAMEPFVSRDGLYLFFNDRNLPADDMDIHLATRVDDLTFDYLGLLDGANSDALDGVPSLGPDGTFYFVSIRSYPQTFSTLHRGTFADGAVADVELIPGLENSIPGIVNFDAEVSPDGELFYYVIGEFSGGAIPDAANLAAARRTERGFEPDPVHTGLLAPLNTEAREYAPSISADGRELFFTRLPVGSFDASILRSVRASTADEWGPPVEVVAATGFVEAITISGDGSVLYFHQRDGDRFVLKALRPS